MKWTVPVYQRVLPLVSINSRYETNPVPSECLVRVVRRRKAKRTGLIHDNVVGYACHGLSIRNQLEEHDKLGTIAFRPSLDSAPSHFDSKSLEFIKIPILEDVIEKREKKKIELWYREYCTLNISHILLATIREYTYYSKIVIEKSIANLGTRAYIYFNSNDYLNSLEATRYLCSIFYILRVYT